MNRSIISEINNKYSEWFEMAGENSPDLMIGILSNMLAKEREYNSYLQLRLKHECVSSAK